jgi:hypothetical protein
MDDFYIPPHQQQRNEVQLAVCQYFAQGGGVEPEESEFEVWAEGLPSLQRVICTVAGFEAAKGNISFRRYCLELRGFSLYEYMTAHLSPTALDYWRTQPDIWGAALNPNYKNPK